MKHLKELQLFKRVQKTYQCISSIYNRKCVYRFAIDVVIVFYINYFVFYDKNNASCRIYEHRPLVCDTYPITDVPDGGGSAVNVGCDYGKDIYRSVLEHMRKRGVTPQTGKLSPE